MARGGTVRPRLAHLARALTLARILATPLFVWALLRVAHTPEERWRFLLIAAYACVILSDLTDGPLARCAGARSYRWGQVDAASDVAFNAAALAAAAWAGRVGPWASLGVLALGAGFLRRCRAGAGRGEDSLPEDGAGKWAGVCFYALVGAVVCEMGLAWAWLRPALPWLGRLAALYALFLLIRNIHTPRGGR